LTRINDVFAKTVTSANTDIEMLFEAMKDGGPVLTAAGASVETFAALVGQMANAGIKGTKAGTTLKNMFLQLQAPVPKAAKLMKTLGLDVVDPLTGSLKDITEILGDFNKATSKMGKAQKSAAIDTIFGKRAIAGVSVLLAKGEQGLKDYRQSLIDAGGSSQDMADIIGKSLGGRLKQLRSAAIEMGFKFIDAFEDKIPGAIDSAVEAVRKFDVKKAIEGIKVFAGWVKKAWKILVILEPVIVGVVAAHIAFALIMKTIVAVKAIAFFFGLVKALRAAAGAQGVLNVVMAANPIMLVVVAIGALVAAGWFLWRNWDTITENWRFAMDELNLAFGAMGDSFSALGADIVSVWNTVKIFFVDAWEGFKMSARDAVSFAGDKVIAMAAKFTGLVTTIKEKWGSIKEFFATLWSDVLASFTSVFTSISDGISNTLARFKGLFGIGAAPAGGGAAPRAAPEGAGREAPNAAAVAAQKIAFQGNITLAGAPPGSTFESSTVGAPPIQTELLGANL